MDGYQRPYRTCLYQNEGIVLAAYSMIFCHFKMHEAHGFLEIRAWSDAKHAAARGKAWYWRASRHHDRRYPVTVDE